MAINGTLAADTLKLDDFAAPLFDSAMPSGPGASGAMISRRPVPPISICASPPARRGWRDLRMTDVAMSVLVKDGRIETALSRAMVHGGTARGRLAPDAQSRR